MANIVVIDLETTSTTPSKGRILSIGAVLVDVETGEERSTYYTHVSRDNHYNSIKEDCPKTMAFWLDDAERAAMYEEMTFNSQHIYHALTGLSDWYNSEANDAPVYGNGSSFDIAFLETKYTLMDMAAPWEFYAVRDARTVVELAGWFGVLKHKFDFEGRLHNALDDARHEAKYITAMLRAIKEGARNE